MRVNLWIMFTSILAQPTAHLKCFILSHRFAVRHTHFCFSRVHNLTLPNAVHMVCMFSGKIQTDFNTDITTLLMYTDTARLLLNRIPHECGMHKAKNLNRLR